MARSATDRFRTSQSHGRSRAGRALDFVVDKPWVPLCIALLALFAWWGIGTRTSDHSVRAAFSSAVSVSPGLDVQIDGVDVGKIGKVQYEDGQAIVEIGVDDHAWPLHQGTTATLRFGTTLGNGTRRIDLEPGPRDAPEIPDDGIISAKDTVAPVEFDEIFNTFDAPTRAAFSGFFTGSAANLEGRREQLAAGVRSIAPAVEATGDVFSDVARDEIALRRLISSGHKATRVLAAKRPVISDLVTVMARTFDTFASNAQGVRESLDEFAPTLRDTRRTLARTDRSIEHLDGLVADLRPGLAALEPLLATARPAAGQLRRLAPQATDTVRELRRSSPGITEFLEEGQPFAARAEAPLARLAEQLKCVRPYAPEIAAWASNWNSWAQGYDDDGHYGRIKAVTGPTAWTSHPPTKTSDFLATLGSGLSYAMPRPPGYNGGKPWFLPECGAGPDALDPTKDPEDR